MSTGTKPSVPVRFRLPLQSDVCLGRQRVKRAALAGTPLFTQETWLKHHQIVSERRLKQIL